VVNLSINGKPLEFNLADDVPLLWALRDEARMTGTKFGCGMGLCGACTVHIEGVAARSCILPISSVRDKKITTIEAVSSIPVGRAIQAAWLSKEVVQCGYCQSGQIMSATALLMQNKNPSDTQIDDAMSGNVCRCGTYQRIREAIKEAAASSQTKRG